MPIIYFEGIKPPCNSTDTQPLLLRGRERWVTISISGLGLSHWTLPTYKFKLLNILHLLEVVMVRRKKLLGWFPTGRLILGIYKSLTDTWMRKLGDGTIYFCFRNNEAAQFHFWEYINWNHTFILDPHPPPPFICNVQYNRIKLFLC